MGLYERLRATHGPVAPVQLDGDVPAWLLLGYRENLEVTRTPSRFSRDSRHWRDLRQGNIAPDSTLLPVIAWQPTCMFADGEEHERLRAAVTESMGRFDRRGIRRHVTRLANQLIDDFSGAGRAELLVQFAQQLPMLVLTHLIGMPDEDGPRLVEASRELIKGSESAVRSNEYVTEAVRQLVARKHVSPGEDLASWLLTHRSDLTDDEVVQHLRLVLLTGNETTTNLIVNTLRMVLTDPRFRASLAGGHMTLPDAVEQVLWNEPPLAVVPGRWATADTELAGQQIKAGDMLLLGLAAGNVDPVIRPDLAAPMHGNRSHLAFSGGPHECPGQDIGRAITDSGIDALLIRLPDLRLSVAESELSWVSSWVARHLVSLPVEFSARRPEPENADALGAQAPVPGSARRPMPGPAPLAPPMPPRFPAPPERSAPAPTRWQRFRRWLRGW
ncbi:cytochrome P450 [Streptomyces sp. H27-D2]|nr:cytochrome P450 [Streptomyces sp. H27-D2]MEC4019562.1 cytochrome P450 [Streptomyces sp. H27-D2]